MHINGKIQSETEAVNMLENWMSSRMQAVNMQSSYKHYLKYDFKQQATPLQMSIKQHTVNSANDNYTNHQ